MKKCLLFFFILSLLSITIGQTRQDLPIPSLHAATFTAYDIDQGLPISCIEQVFTDQSGRIWINPCFEQEMYKGESFFQYDGDKSYDIDLTVTGDSAQSHSWFIQGIQSQGLLYGANHQFTQAFVFDPDDQEKRIFSFGEDEEVINLLAAEDGRIYVLTQSPHAYAVYHISLEGKQLLSSIETDMEVDTFKFFTPATIAGKNIIFLHAHLGFFRYNVENKLTEKYLWTSLLGRNEITAKPINLTSITQRRLLFFLEQANGFYSFDIQTGQLKIESQLSQIYNIIPKHRDVGVSFYKDGVGNILIPIIWYKKALYGDESNPTQSILLLDNIGQLYDYSPVIKKVSPANRYGSTINQSQLIGANFLSSHDFKKEALVSTDGGLIAVELEAGLAIKIVLKGHAGRGIAEIGKDQFLVLSDNGRLKMADLQRGETPNSFKDVGQYICNDNFSIPAYAQIIHQGNEEVWFPTESGDIVSFNKSKRSCERYAIGQSFDKFALVDSSTVAFVNKERELYLFDLQTKATKPFLQNRQILNIGEPACELFVSKDGTLWIASLNGLWQIDHRQGTVKHLHENIGLRDRRLLCIDEAEDGKLWLGLMDGGLHIYDPHKGSMQVIDQSQGLSNNTITGILADDEGVRWVATFSGITALSAKGEVLFKLYEKDGLSHEEFNRFSYLKASDGKLVFGGVSGTNILEPAKIKARFTHQAEQLLYLTELSYFDEDTEVDTLLRSGFDRLEKIILPATHRYLNLNFALSNYIHAKENTFAYQIIRGEGLNMANVRPEGWTTIGNASYLSINDLPSGDHTILIQGTDHMGQTIQTPLVIPFRVKAFFYTSWWFYLLCSIPFLLGGFLWARSIVTDKKRLEEEVARRTQQIVEDKALIEQQAIELKEMDEMKSRFFTNISHEFRTPLTIISGMAGQIQQNPAQWLQKGSELIQRNSQQLLALINQILDLRKLESGALQPNMLQSDIIPYLHYIADSFEAMALTQGVKIHFLSNQRKLSMDYDPDKMLHILSNLLSNAIKYTPEGGDIYIQIDHKTTPGNENLIIQVRDTGSGISQEALPYIFDRFYQVEDLATQKPQGSGVGLALTQELVKLLQGSIEVESTVGQGTNFILNFPISREAPMQAFSYDQPQQKDSQTIQSMITSTLNKENETAQQLATVSNGQKDIPALPSLLIVEDNPDVMLYISSCLEGKYRLSTAANGQLGIDRAMKEVPDIIISDVMMPIKDGYELCQSLKTDERTSHIPIILLTAKADFESRLQGLQQAADSYLTKPFQQQELLLILNNLLDNRKKLQQKYAGDPGSFPLAKARANMEDIFLQKLQQLITDNMEDPQLSQEFICREMGMSHTNLYRKLKALTDLSLSHYIRQLRLHKAKELLMDPRLNISEVADAVGFADPKYFSRIFSETFQQSPSKYRKG